MRFASSACAVPLVALVVVGCPTPPVHLDEPAIGPPPMSVEAGMNSPDVPDASVLPVDAAPMIDANTRDAARGPRVANPHKIAIGSDDPCTRDSDCVASYFQGCCRPCEGPPARPWNVGRLRVAKADCAAAKCPANMPTVECLQPPAISTYTPFCVDKLCELQMQD